MKPDKIDEEISDFLKTINDRTPFYVDVVAAAKSKVNECFVNVEEKISHDGGRHLVGWQIWKTKYLIEAEFHGIWEMPTGEIVDITPKTVNSIDKILFLPDYNKSYQGINVDNIRKNRTANKLVDDLILVSELIFHLLNKGNRAKVREVFLTKSEDVRVEVISKVFTQLQINLVTNSASSSH